VQKHGWCKFKGASTLRASETPYAQNRQFNVTGTQYKLCICNSAWTNFYVLAAGCPKIM
jgi:hypothetical protein